MAISIAAIIFGILTGSLLSVLVGLVGSRRRIGFGWTFLLSIIFTPLIGLIIALISDPLPIGERRWGCLLPMILLIFLAIIMSVVITSFGLILI